MNFITFSLIDFPLVSVTNYQLNKPVMYKSNNFSQQLENDALFPKELECPYCQENIDSLESHVNGGFKNGEKFSCNNCDLVIANEQCLSNHKEIVHRDAMKVFSCETCNIDFTSKNHLFVHKNLDHHQQNRKSEIFEIKTEIKEEVEGDDLFADSTDTFEITIAGKQKFECEQCQKTFSTKVRLLSHVSIIHNGVKNFQCDDCGKKFGYKWNLKSHVKKCKRTDIQEENANGKEKVNLPTKLKKAFQLNDEDIFICDICEKRFKNKYNLKEHMSCVHSEARPFKCEDCSSSFKMDNHLKKHITRVHNFTKKNLKYHSNIKNYQCGICSKTFKRSSALNIHAMSIHTNAKDFECDLCSRKFKDKYSLKQHKKIIHLSIRKFKCDVCPMKFKTSSGLNKHKLKHSEIRKYKCDLCESAFKFNSTLKNHMISMHSDNIRKFKCDQCPKSFKFKDILNKHKLNIHSDERNFKCDLCPKTFKLRYALTSHKLIHSNIKNYKCHICQSTYKLKRYLQLHVMTHSKKKLPCGLCTETFELEDDMKKHLAKMHFVDYDDENISDMDQNTSENENVFSAENTSNSEEKGLNSLVNTEAL